MEEQSSQLLLDVCRHFLVGPAIPMAEFSDVFLEIAAEPLAPVTEAIERNTRVLNPDRHVRVQSLERHRRSSRAMDLSSGSHWGKTAGQSNCCTLRRA